MPIDAEDENLLVAGLLLGGRCFGMRISNNYDVLWYPSSDDVWVTDTRRRWLLELHHEEVFSWYEPVSDPAS